MKFEHIKLDCDDKIAVITINRPEVLNALNRRTLEELKLAIEEIERDRSIHVFIVTGAGTRSFAAGADINDLKKIVTAIESLEFMRFGQGIFSSIERLGKPSIAAVNGYALGGGCELAIACDLRIAAHTAVFGQPEIKLGSIPGWGGTKRLSRLIGTANAKEMIFTGEFITAEVAKELGLVNRVVSQDRLMESARETAKKIALMSPVALSAAKLAINKGAESNLETGLALEAYGVSMCQTTEDQKEGIRAFFEKRKPVFRGI